MQTANAGISSRAGLTWLLFLFLAVPVGANEHESAGDDSAIARHMQLHFTAARAMRTFIISGQLDGVPESADWLINHETPAGLPAGWQPYIQDMRKYAGEAGEAGHLVFAAAALGEMVRTCGACHASNGVEIEFAESLQPPVPSDIVKVQMRRHLWAVERMSEGLVGPSDDAWNQGVAVLAATDLNTRQFDVTDEQRPTLDYLLKLRKQIGERGLAAETAEERSALYGEFLAMCSDCHQLVGRGPRPPQTVMPAGN